MGHDRGHQPDHLSRGSLRSFPKPSRTGFRISHGCRLPGISLNTKQMPIFNCSEQRYGLKVPSLHILSVSMSLHVGLSCLVVFAVIGIMLVLRVLFVWRTPGNGCWFSAKTKNPTQKIPHTGFFARGIQNRIFRIRV